MPKCVLSSECLPCTWRSHTALTREPETRRKKRRFFISDSLKGLLPHSAFPLNVFHGTTCRFLISAFHAPVLRGRFLLLLLLTLQVYVLFGFVFKKIPSAHSRSFCGCYIPIYSLSPAPASFLMGCLCFSGVESTLSCCLRCRRFGASCRIR